MQSKIYLSDVIIYRIDVLVSEKLANNDDEGFIYNLHEKAREILSEYNDTLKGRCSICLEKFCEDDSKL